MCYTAIAFVHENNKASKIGTEKEAKNASTLINVEVETFSKWVSLIV